MNQLTRRDWIAGIAGGLALTTLARGQSIREKAAKNITLGIFGGVYASLPVEEAASRMKADGFHATVTDFQFADTKFNPLEPDFDAAARVISAFHRNGIHISSLYGYYNVVDPHEDRRKAGRARLEALLQHGKRLGCNVVSTETGTLSADSEWAADPKNDTEEAFVACRDVLRELAALAEKHGAILAIEAYWHNIVSTVDRAERMLAEVKSPALKIVMDPCNYYRKDDIPNIRPMLDAMFAKLGPAIALAHAKDFKGTTDPNDTHGTDLPGPGLGVMDYPYFLTKLVELNRPIDLMIEHLELPDVPRARDFVKAKLEAL